MALLAFEDFRCDVIRRTAYGSLALAIELKFSSKAKITDFDFHLVVQEEVTQLEIPMDNSMGMQVLDGIA
jgi:hypothetical protein